ncbi:hypothetical protein LOTGIDRAFT_155063 [Lottia gigantea]|uniref:RING-type domain-containing protein n=1 Tax=Lottia gigantea TaxID=225164 RepID=V3ZSM3_LOTGI|nr:hypothetical protein LOTGIDRAFT_155063 [Lottia gigantea]ESO85575.1 hypothetical protein LOTGIDRAFT_155063 [Lottia gigantea]
MDGNVEEFECAVCLGPFQEPKLLDCHHTFCRKCLEDLASSNLAGSWNTIKCVTKSAKFLMAGSTNRTGDTDYCSKHPKEELKCFCEDRNTILCFVFCLLGQHQNHYFLNIEDSKDVILENYKDQKDSLKRKLEELKTVKNIAEDSLKKINEYRQTALSSCLAELQKNYDQNQKKLNTVHSKVNTLKSQRKIVDLCFLPSCLTSLVLHIQRANYIARVWRLSDQPLMSLPPASNNGWTKDLMIKWVKTPYSDELSDLLVELDEEIHLDSGETVDEELFDDVIDGEPEGLSIEHLADGVLDELGLL